MHNLRSASIRLVIALALSACGTATGVPPSSSASPPADTVPLEAILLLTPGNGSRLVGTVHVEGVADSTFEQHLVVQVATLSDGGFEVIAQEAAVIQAEVGQRGPFSADLNFNLPSADAPGEIRVFSTSARDGGVIHQTAAQVILGADGQTELRPGEAPLERILILSPAPGERLQGDRIRVEGIGLASFEQTLIGEVIDSDGRQVGLIPITVMAPDLGLHGPFSAEIPILSLAAGPARIVVRDVSPAFGQTVHLASVEVVFGP